MFKKVLISIIVLVVISTVYFFPAEDDGPFNYAGPIFINSIAGVFAYFLIIMFYRNIFPNAVENLSPKGSADGILAIFMDKNNKDLHLFSYNSISRAKSGQSRLHLVQHYFIEGDTGKSYYHPLFHYSARSAEMRAGLEGYESFEKDVIPTGDFDESMNKFSKDLGKSLQLGQEFFSEDNQNYFVGEHRLSIQTVEKQFSSELSAVYSNQDTRETLWTTRI